MSSKKGRHPPHEEHVDESWLVPYADILTLLLALFIVLFSFSQVDAEKFEKLKVVLADAFNGSEAIDLDNIPEDIVIPTPPWNTGVGSEDEPDPTDDPGVTGEDGLGGAMGNIYTSLKGYISGNNLENTVKLEYEGEKILLTMQNDIMFASGSAELTAEMKEKGSVLAQILKNTMDPENPFEIIIAGHTDSVPISTGRYPSNLHLSAYRAVEFQLFLISESGLDPIYFSARGYGELHPLDTNDTSEGRSKNRRVELLISQNKEQSDEDVAPGG